ncbi:polysaccharide deacetylase family protein [Caviibacter abscessus]|uniref:polysaccharide deacetylase family protein n=1 Tax=Caviibacter abscessus TaxID=1766719 RepID=UPI0008294F23|nr:polysaccharide deacetylase family protein [Caviibacter abscessus]
MKKYLILFLMLLNIVSCNKKEKQEKPVLKTEVVQIENKEEKQEEKKEEKIEEKQKEDKNKKVVYLTFDDGPTKTTTLEVLRILKENDIKATFFVIGQNPEIYKQIVEQGHKLEIHTYTHKYKEVYASVDSYFADLYRLRDLIKETTGLDPKIVRMPGGSSTTRASRELKKQILRRLKKEGFIFQDWNCDSKDASGKLFSPEEEAENSFCNFKKVNLLMHDTKKSTVLALQHIIDKYKEHGYTFEVLTENSPKFQHMREPKD